MSIAIEDISTADALTVITRNIRKGGVTAEQVEDLLSVMVNGARHETVEGFANALANDHPTLIGQIARSIALGVVRRCQYDTTSS